MQSSTVYIDKGK